MILFSAVYIPVVLFYTLKDFVFLNKFSYPFQELGFFPLLFFACIAFGQTIIVAPFYAKPTNVEIMFKSEEEKNKLLVNIDSFFINSTSKDIKRRNCKNVCSDKISYTTNNRYLDWLLTPAVISFDEKQIYLNVPVFIATEIKELIYKI